MASLGAIPTFKLILVGDGNTGKTSFTRRHLTGEWATEYVATSNIEVHPLIFHTTRGPVKFDIWDIGRKELGGLGEVYYIQSDCAIIMFDMTAPATHKNVPRWCEGLVRMCGNIPMVLCGNKVDNKNLKVSRNSALKPSRYLSYRPSCRYPIDLQYCSISAKSHKNYEKPFLWLARKLMDDANLEFVSAPAPQPTKLQMDSNYYTQTEAQLGEAQRTPLPSQ